MSRNLSDNGRRPRSRGNHEKEVSRGHEMHLEQLQGSKADPVEPKPVVSYRHEQPRPSDESSVPARCLIKFSSSRLSASRVYVDRADNSWILSEELEEDRGRRHGWRPRTKAEEGKQKTSLNRERTSNSEGTREANGSACE